MEQLEEVRERYRLPRVSEARVAYGHASSWFHGAGYKAIMCPDDGRLFGIVSSDYRLAPHEEGIYLLEALARSHEPTLGPFETHVDLYDEGRKMRASVTWPNCERVVVGGVVANDGRDGVKDVINPRLYYTNTYDGSGGESLYLGALRQICVNGLTVFVKRAISKLIHIRVDEDSRRQFWLDADVMLGEFDEQIRVWNRWVSEETSVGETDAILEPFGQKARAELAEEIDRQEAFTKWALYNVITAHITHAIKSLNHRMELERRVRMATRRW